MKGSSVSREFEVSSSVLWNEGGKRSVQDSGLRRIVADGEYRPDWPDLATYLLRGRKRRRHLDRRRGNQEDLGPPGRNGSTCRREEVKDCCSSRELDRLPDSGEALELQPVCLGVAPNGRPVFRHRKLLDQGEEPEVPVDSLLRRYERSGVYSLSSGL